MAAAPSSLGDEIREELKCAICLELFTRPKVLPCQHTFCQGCLQNHAGDQVRFRCAKCRKQVMLPHIGVAGLPDNHLVKSLCDRLQNQAPSAEETREQPQPGNRCSFHASKDLSLYCKQCQELYCVDCVDERHEGHPSMSIEKFAQQQRAPVQALINEGKKVLQKYDNCLRDLRQTEKTLKEHKQQTDHNIFQAFNDMEQKLIARKEHLLAEVEEQHNKDNKIVQDERNRILEDIRQLCAVCDGAEQQMEQGGVPFLIQGIILKEIIESSMAKEDAKWKVGPLHPAVFQPKDTLVPVLGHVPRATFSIWSWGYPLNSVMSRIDTPVSDGPVFGGFGRKGDKQGEFKNPSGVAVSEEREIFVVDHWNKRVQVFDMQREFVRLFPTVMSGGEEMYPHDVAVDGEGNLWVVGQTESAEFAVQYDKQGLLLNRIKLHHRTSNCNRGVAVDTSRNHILITQTTGHACNWHGEVLVFRPDGTQVGTYGHGLLSAQHITVDGEGNILVSDGENHCVHVYNKDGQFLFKFGSEGSGEGQLQDPRGICTDRAGNIIVADYWNRRLDVFDKTGAFLKHATPIRGPYAVAVAPQGSPVVVTDTDINHIVVMKMPLNWAVSSPKRDEERERREFSRICNQS